MRSKWERFYPPGFEWEKEWGAAGVFLGLGGGLSCFRFFGRLYPACQRLYQWERGKRLLREGFVAPPFIELAEGHFLWFVPLLLFLAAMVGYHYFYYYRETKSIYLIRRLEKPSFLIKSCCGGPLMWSVLGIMAAVLLFGLYYGCYLLAMPAESMPRFL